MPLTQFDPPGFVNDLSDELKQLWSEQVNEWVESQRLTLRPIVYQKVFFNELQHPEAENGPTAEVIWEGFPRKWKLDFPTDEQKRWQASEKVYTQGGIKFRYQDEYLEWRTFKKGNKIDKIVFTCEAPEYWRFIADNNQELLLQLYQQYADPGVKIEDLMIEENGQVVYNPSNKWNTTHGIVHLTHGANSLGAEINLASRAAVLRKKGNIDPVVDTGDLICCSGFGVDTRFSDPTIGAFVNSFVQQGLSVTLRNPIALYIHKLNSGAIELPGNLKVKDCWKVIRGDAANGMILRAEFRLPENSGYNMEDIKVGGKSLQYGAQLAELVEMVIYGKAFKMNDTPPPSQPCGNFCESANFEAHTKTFSLDTKDNLEKFQKIDLGLRMINPEAYSEDEE
ncbi:MAG: hypothetical protein WCF67_22685 [Chitinophagaceae bacterium]